MLFQDVKHGIGPASLELRSRGFSMVEMLVSMVVLAVGLLGVASLFAISMHSGSDAIARMQAVTLATDIADKIRANRRAGSAYKGAPADNKCTGASANTCTPGQLAADDLNVWNQQIQQAMPGLAASGKVDFTDGTPATYTIRVTWTEKTGKLFYQTQIQVPTT